jgi:hypothetical protein
MEKEEKEESKEYIVYIKKKEMTKFIIQESAMSTEMERTHEIQEILKLVYNSKKKNNMFSHQITPYSLNSNLSIFFLVVCINIQNCQSLRNHEHTNHQTREDQDQYRELEDPQSHEHKVLHSPGHVCVVFQNNFQSSQLLS